MNKPTPTERVESFECENCGLKHTARDVLRTVGSCQACGDVVTTYTVDAAHDICDLVKQLEDMTALKEMHHGNSVHFATELEQAKKREKELREIAEKQHNTLVGAEHDLITSDRLWACDNSEGHDLFQLEQDTHLGAINDVKASFINWKKENPPT